MKTIEKCWKKQKTPCEKAGKHQEGPRFMDRDSQSQTDNILFQCKTDNAKLLTNMLSCICFKQQQVVDGPLAWMEVDQDGIRIAVEENKNMQVGYAAAQRVPPQPSVV